MRKYLILLICILGFAGNQTASAQSGSQLNACTQECLKGFFDYLIYEKKLFIPDSARVKVSSLVADAVEKGYISSAEACPLLSNNLSKHFYAITQQEYDTLYRARIGDCEVSLRSPNGDPVHFYELWDGVVAGDGVTYNGGLKVQRLPVTRSRVTISWFSVYLWFDVPDSARARDKFQWKRILCYSEEDYGPLPPEHPQDSMLTESNYSYTIFTFDGFNKYSQLYRLLSARVKLFGAKDGTYLHPDFKSPHGTTSSAQVQLYNRDWQLNIPFGAEDTDPYVVPQINISSPRGNLEFDAMPTLNMWQNGTQTGNTKSLSYFLFATHLNGDMTIRGRNYAQFYSHLDPDSTKHPYLELVYDEWDGSSPTRPSALLQIDSCFNCTPIPSDVCYSAVTDTSVNPYLHGLAGNWRLQQEYVYYASRRESDPQVQTNTRRDGVIKDFSAFWNLVDKTWKPQHDASRWTWNKATTLYNMKGLEIENKDPLGRYNAGLYGYSNTLPVAVVSNSRYRESLFEGFEDYYFGNADCGGDCPPAKLFDRTLLDSVRSHTGRYSLKVAQGTSVGIGAEVVAAAQETFQLTFNRQADVCITEGTGLKEIRTTKDALLPAFSPTSGGKVLVSAWVKEELACNCTGYTGNQIAIVVETPGGNQSTMALPAGSIIEGWQRYEQVVELPAGATKITVSLAATGNTDVYFDDLRIHPYHANMKSYVYHPENLRLMAELDENNYATFYEYDDDGSLIRLKKETIRGIKTIRETRNALLKEEESQ